MAENRDQSISWADLFLALFYSATIVLFVAWIRNCELPNLPQPLGNMVGKFASWVFAGLASAAISAIFRKSLSWLVLVWTAVLTCGLLFVLKCGPPVPPAQVETWSESEGGRPPITWHVDYTGIFPCPPNVGISASCKATRNGTQRIVDRVQSSDGNVCLFDGTVFEDSIDGTYHCTFGMTGGVATWNAKIIPTKRTLSDRLRDLLHISPFIVISAPIPHPAFTSYFSGGKKQLGVVF
jgi:hypothetical protein